MVEDLSVTREHVVSAFRLILGRAPESEKVVEDYCSRGWTLSKLRRAFIESEEFADKFGLLLQRSSQKPLTWPHIHVDVDVSNKQLNRMIRHVEADWEQLGKEAPHWSVLTSDCYKPDSINTSVKEFFDSGADALHFFEAAAGRCGIDLSRLDNCFELGCGVGRVTIWLSKHFRRVLAADISQSHLQLAIEAATQRDLLNVDFVHLDKISKLSTLPVFDCFFSILVLQHNPPPVIKAVLTRILDRIAPGGVGYFQVPTYRKGYEFRAGQYLETMSNDGKIELHVILQQTIMDILAQCGCKLLELREDNWAGSPSFISNSFLVKKELKRSQPVDGAR